MGSIRGEFHRFLTTLARGEVSEDVRKLGSVIWANLDALAEVGAGRRARSKRLVPLAIQELDASTAEIPAIDGAQAAGRPFVRVDNLVVGPFRGFMRQETFDLSRPVSLIYGANGTGKSSLCEALELALLGYVNEAEAKRIDLRAYCNNARLGRHTPPALSVQDEAGGIVPCIPNEEALRFCFVERNRIEGFARIAARTPGDQRQLIATLFGVDEFDNFVRGFNPDLDQDLNLEGDRAKELGARRQGLVAAEQIVNSQDQRAESFCEQDIEWSSRVLPGGSYEDANQWLFGSKESPGRLPSLQTALDAPVPALRGLRRADLEDRLRIVLDERHELEQLTEQLRSRASEVSFQQLYEAVSALSEVSPEACPACGTALTETFSNPYDRAREGLHQLAELAALQRLHQDHRQALVLAKGQLFDQMQRVLIALAESSSWNGLALPQEPTGKWLSAWLENDRSAWTELLAGVDQLELVDQATQQALVDRGHLIEERNRLAELEREHVALVSAKELWARELEEARSLIARFEETNRALIAEVVAERPIIELHLRVKMAYDTLLAHLRRFMADLPGQMLHGLGERARVFFNGFNREDPPGDLLSALHLPVAENEKIELEFEGEPGQRYDALLILSEGHIRCLGLAILLAKNVESSCPVVIFDDAVNAIDDDHRAGIWRTLFEDGELGGKQIILTSHAEEFLGRIEQVVDPQNVGKFKFLPHEGEHELRVDTNPPSKNYVSLAQSELAADNKRDALLNCRRGLENLTDRLWTWTSRRQFGPLELKLIKPGAPYELRNKCEKLRALLRNRTDPPALQGAYNALDAMLGVDGGSIEWGYLNSGTHEAERRHEFDRSTVRSIVEALTQLKGALDGLTGQNRGSG